MTFDRKIFFDEVRTSLFGGTLTQQQVDGMGFKLAMWETHPLSEDLRHPAYCLATAKHETDHKMWPVEEYGKGKGKEYGKPHPKTGKVYYGRGDIQTTWYENYLKTTTALGLSGEDDLTLYPEKMLQPSISARAMYLGMTEGWYRGDKTGRHTLARYFDLDTNDSFMAREIINGDKNRVPEWSGGKKIGTIIAEYHDKFLIALLDSLIIDIEPEPPEEPVVQPVVRIETAGGVEVWLNGVQVA